MDSPDLNESRMKKERRNKNNRKENPM